MYFRCFSLSARIDFAHLGEKQTHILCNGTCSALFFLFEGVKDWNAKHGGWFQTQKWKRNESSPCFEVCVWSWSSFSPLEYEYSVTSRFTVGAVCAPIWLSGSGIACSDISSFQHFVFLFFYRPSALIWRKKLTRNIEKTRSGLTMVTWPHAFLHMEIHNFDWKFFLLPLAWRLYWSIRLLFSFFFLFFFFF